MIIEKLIFIGNEKLIDFTRNIFFQNDKSNHLEPIQSSDWIGLDDLTPHLTFKFTTYITIACYFTFFNQQITILPSFSLPVFFICKKKYKGNSVKFTTT